MIAYMSYWSGGDKLGLPSEFTINLFKLSVFFAKKIFNDIHLITDSRSIPYFENIGFSSISTELDIVNCDYSKVWSLGKLYAYKLISEKQIPFIHIDHDVFLLNKLDERILKADVFAQSPENIIKYFYQIDKLIENCSNLHDIDEFRELDLAYNVGIFGGNDLLFINEYAKKSIDFVLDPHNKYYWLEFDSLKTWSKSVIAEQFYLSVMIEKNQKKIELLFPDGWPKNYIHFMGAKSSQNIRSKINLLIKKYKL